MNTREVTATLPPTTKETELKLMSAPLVPTEPSRTNAAAEVTILNHVAVPVAFAEASAVIALNVSVPDDAAAAVGVGERELCEEGGCTAAGRRP